MIVLIDSSAGPDAIEALFGRVKEMGLEVMTLDDARGSAFEVIGQNRGQVLALRDTPGVAGILTRRVELLGGEPLWPHFVLRLMILLLVLLVAIALLSAFAPPGLGDRADPGLESGNPVDWYLRPLAVFLRLFPGRLAPLGGILASLTWVLFLMWPFLDRANEATRRGRRAALLVRLLGVALLIFVVVLALVPLS